MDYSNYADKVYKIIGASMDVYNELGFGLLEPVYQEALEIELKHKEITCEREKLVEVFYKGVKLDKFFKLDFMVEDVIVELKSMPELTPKSRSQLFNYMRLTNTKVGLLINFGAYGGLEGERYVMDENRICHCVDKNMKPLPENNEYII